MAKLLPEIKLTCRDGHSFTSRARGGMSVSCPVCRKDGQRVSVWVPKDRPHTDREATDRRAREPEPDYEMTARWASEPEWNGRMPLRPGRPADACPECEAAPVGWEPGRTLIYCQPCEAAGRLAVMLPAAVAAHYERQERRRAEVAVRDRGTVARPDAADERAARVRLHAAKETVRRTIESWLDGVADEDSYDYAQWQRKAFELGATLRGYLAEVGRAGDEESLTVIWAEVQDVLRSDECKALTEAYEQAQSREQRQFEAQERAKEIARQEQEAAAEAERQQRADEAEARRQQRAAETAAAKRQQEARTNPYAPAMAMIADYAAKRERRLAERGACQFRHRWAADGTVPAVRLYAVPVRDWQGNMTGEYYSGGYRACAKHYANAEAQLHADGYQDVAYWGL